MGPSAATRPPSSLICRRLVNDLIVVCPTRHPDKAGGLWADFLVKHAGDTRLVFAVDHEDPQAYSVPHGRHDSHSAVEALNLAALDNVHSARYLGYMGDDMEIVTPDWDLRVIRLLDRVGGGLAFVNDLTFDGPPMATTIFMNSTIVGALGWLALPDLRELYFDDVWADLGRLMGRSYYLPDVLIRHHGLTDHPEAFVREKPIYERWRARRAAHDAELALWALK